MSVHKRRFCSNKKNGCKFESLDSTQLKNLPPCPKCGAETQYSKGWIAMFRVTGADGSKIKHKKSLSSKADALEYEAKMLTRRAEGEVVDKSKDLSFQNAVKVFFDFIDSELKKNKIAKGTADPYKYNTTLHLLPYFKGSNIDAITMDDVEAFVEDMEDKPLLHHKTGKPMVGREGYAPATINRCLAALSRIMYAAKKKRLIKHNQLDGIKLLNEDNCRERFLLPDEIDRLLAVCSAPRKGVHRKGIKGANVLSHLYRAVLLGLNTGLRIEGVLTLRWSEIDWRRNEIVKVVKHRRSSGPKTVHIPMNEMLRTALLKWKKEDGVRDIPPPTGFVIPSPVNPAEHILIGSDFGFKKACIDAGIGEGFTFHQLRHTFCTHFLEQYPDKIEVLMEIVGHGSAYMTRRYAHITSRSKHEAMQNFSLGSAQS